MMTSHQYRKAIADLGLNQVQAARFLGVSERTSRNWAANGAPPMAAMLLCAMIEKDISVAEMNRIMKRKEDRR